MPTLNPDHFLDQAERAVEQATGRPRQVDLRRAISSCYYGIFHLTLAALADEFVGIGNRNTARYALVYRSLDHRRLREVCVEVGRTTAAGRYAAYLPRVGLASELRLFATSVIEAQQGRHSADYDPLATFKAEDVRVAVATARQAIRSFAQVAAEERRLFLTLLLCPPGKLPLHSVVIGVYPAFPCRGGGIRLGYARHWADSSHRGAYAAL
jgi:hypothetical protein